MDYSLLVGIHDIDCQGESADDGAWSEENGVESLEDEEEEEQAAGSVSANLTPPDSPVTSTPPKFNGELDSRLEEFAIPCDDSKDPTPTPVPYLIYIPSPFCPPFTYLTLLPHLAYYLLYPPIPSYYIQWPLAPWRHPPSMTSRTMRPLDLLLLNSECVCVSFYVTALCLFRMSSQGSLFYGPHWYTHTLWCKKAQCPGSKDCKVWRWGGDLHSETRSVRAPLHGIHWQDSLLTTLCPLPPLSYTCARTSSATSQDFVHTFHVFMPTGRLTLPHIAMVYVCTTCNLFVSS